jgi:arsenate reductase
LPDRPVNVLFLCTGNSARSILAESLLNRLGNGRFRAFSAGSMPTGRVNPHAIELLCGPGYGTDGLRSKSWSEFAAPGAPVMDLIITVCDNAAGEVCPIWPGHPTSTHWGVPDPAAVHGSPAEIKAAFSDACGKLERRIRQLVDLPVDQLDSAALKSRLDEIHDTADVAPDV